MNKLYLSFLIFISTFLSSCSSQDGFSLDTLEVKTVAESEEYSAYRLAVSDVLDFIAKHHVDLYAVQRIMDEHPEYKYQRNYPSSLFSSIPNGEEFQIPNLAKLNAFKRVDEKFNFRSLPKEFTTAVGDHYMSLRENSAISLEEVNKFIRSNGN